MGCTGLSSVIASILGRDPANKDQSRTSNTDSFVWSSPTSEPTNLPNFAGFAAYPPRVKEKRVLGYVKDVNSIGYSRDIGRSFQLLGETYVIFGDTFCKDHKDCFVGVTNNTVAVLRDRKHLSLSSYLEIEQNGMVKPFVPLNIDEEKWEKNGCGFVKLWGFGGVVELEDGTGRIWYQKSIIPTGGGEEYIGTGVAIVTPKPWGGLIVERLEGLAFGPDEPRAGTFSAILEGSNIYLYGEMEGTTVLARVPRNCTGDKEWYRFWNGREYAKDYKEAVPVFKDLQHGCIFRSKLFGARRPWVFVGCNKWADNHILIGASAALEGPWELTATCKAEGIDIPIGPDSYMYCMYAHPWASDEEKAQLMVTWSEKWPGGVVAARLTLAAINDGDVGS